MRKLTAASLTMLLAFPSNVAFGEPLLTRSKNMYGTPSGLIDMPTAEMAPDGELATTLSYWSNQSRTMLTFQILPRLSGTFRYSALRDYRPGRGIPGATVYPNSSYYDRSFDVSYLLLKEGKYRPAVAIGLRDLIGTGLYGSEYIVATKSFSDRLRFTGGIGWGRLGSYNSFATMGTRPTTIIGAGGVPTYDRWFRGPVSAFGGVSYQATDKLQFAIEYSSDAYPNETGQSQDKGANLFTRKSPWNVGVDYQLNNALRMGAYYLYGSEVGLNFTIALNPKSSPVPGGGDTAPLPVMVRPKFSASDLGWTTTPGTKAGAQTALAAGLAREGLVLEGIKLDGRHARVLVRNTRWDIEAQAVGRAARVMSRNLPASVETFEVVQVSNGVPLSSVSMSRSDVERLENAPAERMYDRVTFGGGAAAWNGVEMVDGTYPRLSWSLGPYAKLSVFDPDNPVRVDVGAQIAGDYYLAPGWVLSGAVTVKATGNIGDQTPGLNSFGAGAGTLPAVRSDAAKYSRGNDPKIDYLTLAKYGRLGNDIYSRLTVGYLETMYAGVSGELLWKPVGSRLALGAELNYVAQRNFDQLFGVQNYNVATGHLSAYYDFGNDFHGQLDVGRYLAKDWGATVAIDREFDNGWSIGAYATKTNVSASDFGEGTFDKGLRFTMPLSWAVGTATRRKNEIVVKSLSRNGGAKLNVNGRLYDTVRDTHQPEMAKTWGRFWR
ncbi:YjbH domain-containing protein [Rhodalgimonas zhirmunskyi]|uniref:YjbH domain-containing protein n=1 Tax=Rhodalgimonas zhirmunskyi TaxID=2964767 RepID=A0AAJ1U5J4_9RHOB|nr:YjbH domain-containing protein [Rhodoalgimonas zhirmunskyi]MDQ2094006.1 YjbH domain-containing protein [Rhodoalgimonas zhirmunskyi]